MVDKVPQCTKLLYSANCHHKKRQTWAATVCMCVIICIALWVRIFVAVKAPPDVAFDVDLIMHGIWRRSHSVRRLMSTIRSVAVKSATLPSSPDHA